MRGLPFVTSLFLRPRPFGHLESFTDGFHRGPTAVGVRESAGALRMAVCRVWDQKGLTQPSILLLELAEPPQRATSTRVSGGSRSLRARQSRSPHLQLRLPEFLPREIGYSPGDDWSSLG